MKLLVIAGEVEVSASIRSGLGERGHDVDLSPGGRDGLIRATEGDYEVLIIDRMLHGLDGVALVQTLRGLGVTTPVLLLTPLGSGDRVRGLDAGGGDYLVKPFAVAELLARVNALARRPPLADAPVTLRVADLELDLLQRSVTRGSHRIALQPREFQLLQRLMRSADRIVSRTMLLESVWDHAAATSNIVETHICRLRAKLNQYGGPDLIQTIRNAGYALRSSVSDGP